MTDTSNVLTAPEPLAKGNYHLTTIFLAGSIEQDKAEHWQKRATDFFQGKKVTLLNPRREQWDSSWRQEANDPHFREQVEWELEAMQRAHIIMMYFDPTTKSPITLLELGLHARSKKLRVCCPEGFWRRGNVQIVCEQNNVLMFDTLDEMLESIQTDFKL